MQDSLIPEVMIHVDALHLFAPCCGDSVDDEVVSPQPRNAIQSLRLRLHSGLRQRGVGLWFGCYWQG
jgi:hypothetical protein